MLSWPPGPCLTLDNISWSTPLCIERKTYRRDGLNSVGASESQKFARLGFPPGHSRTRLKKRNLSTIQIVSSKIVNAPAGFYTRSKVNASFLFFGWKLIGGRGTRLDGHSEFTKNCAQNLTTNLCINNRLWRRMRESITVIFWSKDIRVRTTGYRPYTTGWLKTIWLCCWIEKTLYNWE